MKKLIVPFIVIVTFLAQAQTPAPGWQEASVLLPARVFDGETVHPNWGERD